MKYIKLFVILINIVIISNCYSQSGWFWLNPRPVGYNTTQTIEVLDNGTVLIGGDAGMLLKSLDNGVNWSPITSGVDHQSSIYDIKFINDQTGFICGSGFIKASTDGGNSWVSRFSTNSLIYRLFILNPNTMFAAAENQIFKSSNAGLSWYSIYNFSYLRSVAFLNSTTGVAVGFNQVEIGGWPPSYYTRSIILRTSNGGNSWIQDSLGNGFLFNDVAFDYGSNVYIAGSSGMVFKSTDYGSNWLNLFQAGTEYKRILIVNSNRIFISGGGLLLNTSNGGSNWIYQSAGGENYDVSYNLSGIGFLVSGDGKIHRTTDSGLHWVGLQNGFVNSYSGNEIRSIHFVNSNTGYAVGVTSGANTNLKTTNGGINWEIVYGNQGALSDIFFVNANTGFMVGYSTIRKTTNQGANWTETVLLGGDLYSVHFIDENTGFAGGHGRICKTTNSGQSWNTVFSDPVNKIYDISFVNDSVGGACGSAQTDGYILWTTDQGYTWTLRSSGLSIYTVFNGISVLSSTSAVIACRDAKILRTTNSGLTWFVQNFSGYSFNEVCFRDALNGLIVGNNGVILKTTNAGINWVAEQSNTRSDLNDCSLAGNGYVAAGNRFAILGTNVINQIGIQSINSEIPKNSLLSQNYPNPFNPQTKIRFDVPSNVKRETSNVKLVIYDLLGREVATLVNDELKPGTYEADWDGSNFSSGVYFYKIITEGFVETKKMVLMK